MYGLPFAEIWALDFEFTSKPGARPVPVCLVARELHSGRLLRLWQDELGPEPPFRTDDQALFIAYFASAEWGCFEALRWSMPARVIDLYVEFRVATNGIPLPNGRGLLSALSAYCVPGISSDEKQAGRQLVMRGSPWSDSERREILDYCQTDVDCLEPLFERMILSIRQRPLGLGQAVLRGRYTEAVARMEHVGVPIDVKTLAKLRAGWKEVKLGLIRDVDKEYGVYDGTTFKAGLFADWLDSREIDWPRLSTGKLALDGDTFRDMSKTHPCVAPLKNLRHTLGEMRLEELAVGPDRRNRTLLSPYGARTGRNTPSNTKFIFGPSTWLRSLIKPEAGTVLAYVDWSSQEVAIAASLSGDEALLDAVRSGDPYLAFAKRAKLAPPAATKKTHREVRDVCKTVVLGVNYGMQALSLSLRIGTDVIEARELLRRLDHTFPTYTDWAQRQVDAAVLRGWTSTVFGWPLHVLSGARATTLRNFPMQANGAEMLRIACCLATERGIRVCAPVHDALLVEAPSIDVEQVVAGTRAAMDEAARAVCPELEIRTDVTLTKYPRRYRDERGAAMWRQVTQLL